MKLLHAWAESLLIFKPDNAKKFLYVTGRALRFSYPPFIHWFSLGALLVFMLSKFFNITLPPFEGSPIFYFWGSPLIIPLLFAYNIVAILPLLLACIVSRASTADKNFNLQKYVPHSAIFAVVLIGILFLFLIGAFLIPLSPTLAHLMRYFSVLAIAFGYSLLFLMKLVYHPYLLPFWGIITPALVVTWLSFYFDLPKFQLFKSLGKAITMIFFNAPMYILFNSFMWSLIYLIWQATTWIGLSQTTFAIITYLLTPIPVSIFTNLYIMKLHQQPELYFDKPIKE